MRAQVVSLRGELESARAEKESTEQKLADVQLKQKSCVDEKTRMRTPTKF